MQKQIYFSFISINFSSIFKIEFNSNVSNDFLISFLKDFIQAFNGNFCLTSEGNNLEINCYQQKNHELEVKISDLVTRYRNSIPPINRINDFIKKLSENENFFLLPADLDTIPTKNKIMMLNELASLNNPH